MFSGVLKIFRQARDYLRRLDQAANAESERMQRDHEDLIDNFFNTHKWPEADAEAPAKKASENDDRPPKDNVVKFRRPQEPHS